MVFSLFQQFFFTDLSDFSVRDPSAQNIQTFLVFPARKPQLQIAVFSVFVIDVIDDFVQYFLFAVLRVVGRFILYAPGDDPLRNE